LESEGQDHWDETAFLHGNLEESIFMEIPSGKELGNVKCIFFEENNLRTYAEC
jgi:hypothetical protein